MARRQEFNRWRGLPFLGGGIGFRLEQANELSSTRVPLRWLEVISENFVGVDGYPRAALERVAEHFTILPHGVGLSLGSTDPINHQYLAALKKFADELDAPWVSDHLCFTMVDHINLEQLIPLPFTRDALANVVDRIKLVQDTLGRPFLVENVTRYMTVSDREMNELEFICRVLEGADCGLLLDLTNVYLNGRWHGFEPMEFIRQLPLHRVGQIHLAGWEPAAPGATIIDTHSAAVPEVIWSLLADTAALTGPVSVLIERDDNLPAVAELVAEARRAEAIVSGEGGDERRRVDAAA